MSEDQRFGETQGTNTNTGGRSPEYRDNLTERDRLTVQDETRPAGSSGFEAARSVGVGTQDTNADLTTGRSYDAGGTNVDATRGAFTSDAAHLDRSLGDNTDGLGRDRTDRVTADETGTLISADKVQGTAVYDSSGERLGTIDSLMLNKRSGKVAYAVMSFGGFLGIGERYHPLPWDKLTYDVDKGGYNVGATTDELRAGPTYSRDELDEFEVRDRDSEVDDYYGRGMPSALEGGITRSGGIPNV